MDFENRLINLRLAKLTGTTDKKILIEEAFLVWYILTEGIKCDSFTETELSDMLDSCAEEFQNFFYEDSDCLFIFGWMLTVSFWFFEGVLREDEGYRFIEKASKIQPTNNLYKWAMQRELTLTQEESVILDADILANFDQHFAYGSFIREYFFEVIKF